MLEIHIAGGVLGLVLGAGALWFRKGSVRHIKVGRAFVYALLLLGLSGSLMSMLAGKPFDALSGLLASYMVLSGWFAFTEVSQRITLLSIAGAAMGAMLYVGIEVFASVTGVRATDAPNGAGYVFGGVFLIALYGDVRVWRGLVTRVQKVRRHLWRMNFALFTATASFFGARPHLFPEWMQTYGILLLLSFLPLLLIMFWMIKLKFSRASTAV